MVQFLFIMFVILTPSKSYGIKGPWISFSAKGNRFSIDDFEDIHRGPPTQWLSLGGGLGLDLTRQVSIGANCDVLLRDKYAMVEMYAYILTAEIGYLHSLSKTFGLGGGAGFGSIHVSGQSNYYLPAWPRPFWANGVNGDDLLFKCFSAAKLFLSQNWALTIEGGYRWACVEELESDSGERLITPEGHPAEADYSGWFLGIDIRLHVY
jgi:hypothetical protein